MQKTKLMKLLNIFLSILILLILIVYYSNLKTIMDYDIELQRITILAIIIFLYCLVTSMLCKSKITNLSIIYIVFYMIFIFGSFIAHFCFNFSEENTEALYKMMDPYYLLQAGILSIYCLLGIHIGAAIASYTTKQAELKEKEEVIDKEIVIKTIRRVSAILLVISTLSAIITFYNNAILAYQGGYSAVYSTTSYGINSLHEKLEPFFYVGLLLLMVSYKEQRKKANVVFLINLLYNGVQIFFGARGLPILRVLMLLLTYHFCNKTFSKKAIVVGLVLLIPVVGTVSMLKSVRKYPIEEWLSKAAVIWQETMEDQPILTTINEMGMAIFPTAASIQLYPETFSYKYGTTYLYGLTTIIPNISSGQTHMAKQANVSDEVGNYFGISFGGSVVEDIYANFGWFCPLAAIFIGFFLYRISDKVMKRYKQNYILFPLYAALSVEIIWTVRNTINPIIRYFVWYILTTYILYKLLYQYYKKKEKDVFDGNREDFDYHTNLPS